MNRISSKTCESIKCVGKPCERGEQNSGCFFLFIWKLDGQIHIRHEANKREDRVKVNIQKYGSQIRDERRNRQTFRWCWRLLFPLDIRYSRTCISRIQPAICFWLGRLSDLGNGFSIDFQWSGPENTSALGDCLHGSDLSATDQRSVEIVPIRRCSRYWEML